MIEQKIIGRMQVIAELLGIETGHIDLYYPQAVGDFALVKRWVWDMYVDDVRFGGKVVSDIHDGDYDPITPLTRSFAHYMTRVGLSYGEYERLAELAFCETPPPALSEETAGGVELSWILDTKPCRKSTKELLNDLILLCAQDIVHSAIRDTEEPESIPNARDILGMVLSSSRIVSLVQDIDTYRRRVIRDHKA